MNKGKILIIDDEVDYCVIMKNYFANRKYNVQIAFNLTEGLEQIEEFKPDILFLDNNLPDGKGWSHVEPIVEKNPHLKLFLVSAYHQKGDFSSSSPNVTVWEKPLSLSVLNANF